MSESIDVQTMQISQVSGVAARWIARPYCPLTTVAKPLVSLVSRYTLAPGAVDAILARVRDATVVPFFDPPWNRGLRVWRQSPGRSAAERPIRSDSSAG